MEPSLLQEANGNSPFPPNNIVNGSDTSTTARTSDKTNITEFSVNTHHIQDPLTNKSHDEMVPNGNTFDSSSYNHKVNDDKTHDNMHPNATKVGGTSPPPPEHKQHLQHLPLRKRHLLASSTATTHVQDSEPDHHTVHNSPPTDHQEPQHRTIHERKPTDTTNIHTEPLEPPEPSSNDHIKTHDTFKPHSTTNDVLTKHEPHNTHNSHEPKEGLNEHKVPKNEFHNTDSPSHQLHQSHSPPQHSPHSQPPQNSHRQQPSHSPSQTHLQSQSQHLQHSNNSPRAPTQHSSSHSQSSSHSHHSHSQHHSHIKQHNTHSPTRTQSPTLPSSPSRTHSPSSQSQSSTRHSSSRGRGGGRGRGKSNKAEGSASSGSSGNGDREREEVYCFCRRPYDPTVDVFMIGCDSCDEWYHGSCVGINQREAKKIAHYVCPRCKKTPTSPPSTSTASGEVSEEDEPASPPSSKSKKRKNESHFKTEPKRQAVSPSLSDNGVESPGETPEAKSCLNCSNQAVSKSKYCSQECGVEYARKEYRRSNGGNGNSNGTVTSNGGSLSASSSKVPSSATDIADKEALDEIAKKKAEIAEKLAKLEQEQMELDKAIQFARSMDSVSSASRPTSPVVLNSLETGDESKHGPTQNSENTTIDCVSCGHPISLSKFPLHMERCFHKKESNVVVVGGTTTDSSTVYCNVYDNKSKTFCKRLKHACAVHAAKRDAQNINSHPHHPNASLSSNGMSSNGRVVPTTCGCPTSDFASGYCELTRKACVKHHNWEELMRDSISNQRAQHNKAVGSLTHSEHAVRLRMARRTQPTATSHRTIEEA